MSRPVQASRFVRKVLPMAVRALVCPSILLVGSPLLLAQAQSRPPVRVLPPAARTLPSQTPAVRSTPPPAPPGAALSRSRPSTPTQPHLSQWMESHRNLPPAQQQSALEAEPGFRDLKPQEQQRMRNLVSRLNTMPADQRQRTIARTEWMERLQPLQRQQVRGAMAQLGGLPPERAHAVGRLFRSLQAMPEPERQAYLNSPQFHSQYSDQERATLGNLLTVAPLIPPPVPATAPH